MTLALAKYLVDQDLVTPDQMDDVLQRQVVFGGTLDTNILELGLLDEEVITQALSSIHRLPVATTDLLSRRDPRMSNLFPARLAEKHQVVPVTMSGRSVFVLACTRVHPLVVEEIGFMLSLAVKTYLVCEARLQGFLRAWFKVEIEPRYSALLDRMGKFSLRPTSLSDRLPAQMTTREALPGQIDQTRVDKVLVSIEKADRKEQQERERARVGKISLQEATHICLNADRRDEIIDTTLRFARQFSSYVALFVIGDDSILGWDAVGTEGASEQIKKVRFSTGTSSVLNTVIQTRAYYLGPLPESVGNNEMLQLMGRTRPRNAFVVPITLKSRLIGLLYGDAGPKSIRGGRLVELLVFTSRLSAAFEQLIFKMKAAADKALPGFESGQGSGSSTIAPSKATIELAELAAKQALKAAALSPGDEEKWSPETAVQLALETTALELDSHPPPPEIEPESPPPEEYNRTSPLEVFSDPKPIEKEKPPTSAQPPSGESNDDFPLPPSVEENTGEEEPVVVGANFLDSEAESGRELSFPLVDSSSTIETHRHEDAQTDRLHPSEVLVKVEDLAEPSHGSVVVDTEANVVLVDTDGGFAPTITGSTEVTLPVLSGNDDHTKEDHSSEPPDLETVELVDGMPDPSTVIVTGFEEPVVAAPDVSSDAIEQLCEELLGENPEEVVTAGNSLVSIGIPALPFLLERFPGRLRFDIQGAHDSIPPVHEHSELLRCLIEIGADAGPAVMEKLEDDNPVIRYYAVKLFSEIYCPRSLPSLAERLYDRNALIRLTAVDTLQTYRKTTAFDKLLANLRADLKADDPNQQAIAAALLGNFKDCHALPLLTGLVKSSRRMVARSAIESLSYITKQDFGSSERKWLKWWKTHKGQNRVQWLIAGLSSKNRDIRFSSSQELTQITREYFGYYFDSSKDDREKAIRRWEKW